MIHNQAIYPSNAEATFIQSTRTHNLNPVMFGIPWKGLTEYSQMNTHLQGFQSFFMYFASFCIGQISHQKHKG